MDNLSNQQSQIMFDLHRYLQPYLKAQEAGVEPLFEAHHVHSAPSYSCLSQNEHILNPRFPTDPNATIDNDVHGLFSLESWITNLPMNEIQNLLLPALRLATKFISDDRALEWFVHVRYSRVFVNDSKARILVWPGGPITRTMTGSVKNELQAFAGHLKFTWFSPDLVDYPAGNRSSLDGLTLHDLADILSVFRCIREVVGLDRAEEFVSYLQPFICISIKYFLEFFSLRHKPYSAFKLRMLQFEVATVILHEFAHVWMHYCHGGGFEPLAFPTDVIPEAGFSWEQFMFGSIVFQADLQHEYAKANTLSGRFATPFHDMVIILPHAWVDQWFLKSTWNNFVELQTKGMLSPPATADPNTIFGITRFCPVSRTPHQMFYINGHLLEVRGCKSGDCVVYSDLTRPKNTEFTIEAYLKIRQSDREIARKFGVEFGKDDGPRSYKTQVRLMQTLQKNIEAPGKIALEGLKPCPWAPRARCFSGFP